MTQIRTRNDRYSPLYQVQAGLTALCFVLLIAQVTTTTTTTTTTASAEESGR